MIWLLHGALFGLASSIAWLVIEVIEKHVAMSRLCSMVTCWLLMSVLCVVAWSVTPRPTIDLGNIGLVIVLAGVGAGTTALLVAMMRTFITYEYEKRKPK